MSTQLGPYEKSIQQLPRGHKATIMVPRDTTPEELSRFLWNAGINCPPEAISLRDYPNSRQAVVSFPNASINALLTWLVGEKPFRGERLLTFNGLGRHELASAPRDLGT